MRSPGRAGGFLFFRPLRRLADTVVVVLVAAITLVFDLAVAVIVGVVVSALVFAWQHAKQISVTTSALPGLGQAPAPAPPQPRLP